VIEVEYDGIAFTTVDAGMRQQIVVCEQLASISVPQMPLSSALSVRTQISPVVFSAIRATTVPTIASARSAPRILGRKVFDGLP